MKLANLFETTHNDENKDMNKTPPIGDTGSDLLTTAQAAKFLGVTMSRIRQHVMDGRLKTHQPTKGRRDHLIKMSDLEKFKDEGLKDNGRPPKDESDKKDK